MKNVKDKLIIMILFVIILLLMGISNALRISDLTLHVLIGYLLLFVSIILIGIFSNKIIKLLE